MRGQIDASRSGVWTVKGLSFVEVGEISWDDQPDPVLQEDTDAILRVTMSAICGTDVHIINGGVPDTTPGVVLGHEGVGVVEAVGAGVKDVKAGDRVLAAANSACGACELCSAGKYGQCLRGGWLLGHRINGLQAELARIPFANNSLYKIPDGLDDEQVILLTDNLVTGYEVGVARAKVQPGDTVVVIGAGPVGLSTVLSGLLFSPSEIIVVDPNAFRREKALELGASRAVTPDGARQVVGELTGGMGADVTIDAAGNPASFELAVDVVRTGGHVANIGGHEAPIELHLERLWTKEVTITTAIPSGLSTPRLMKTILAGKLDGRPVITHRLSLSDIVKGYELFRSSASTNALKITLSN